MFWWTILSKLSEWSPRWLERLRVRRARRRGLQRDGASVAPTRLLLDVTTIARQDRRTGIQRVVRSVAAQMALHPGECRIAPVRYEANAFRHTAWPAADVGLSPVLCLGEGDVFLGLDLSLDAIRRQVRRLLRCRRAGTRFWFVVYDLLPVQNPQYFSAKVAVRFRWWLIATAKLADGYLCISPHVADEMRALLTDRFGIGDQVEIAVLPMGFDITDRVDPPANPIGLALPRNMANSVLAVGTLEPRKGYSALLDAFEILWMRGSDAKLLIVGAPGWKTDPLQQRIRSHAEIGRRLYWLSAVDDDGLTALYAEASFLVAASYGEGFGLPVLEAIARSCPVLARNIPAFRAHARFGLRYFKADANAGEIADAIANMLSRLPVTRVVTRDEGLPRWRDAAAYVRDLLAR
jgi:glycosyltransferase involved in cell wall biosynthesis